MKGAEKIKRLARVARAVRLPGLVMLLIAIVANTWLVEMNHKLHATLTAEQAELRAEIAKLKAKSAELKVEADEMGRLNSEIAGMAAEGEKATGGPACQVIHLPKQGCPAGYVREALPRFTERDGSKEFACVSDDVRKKECVDVLKPGEEVAMGFISPDF